ncbi:MAG: tRNA pseudouridine(38-40) synthase TruA [Bacteroidales bacterium]|nr:tRNA pseudouridine(38-40) synthase TruA [Bacteroidales bacterium]
MRYFVKLSFNGAAFHGWQKQPGEISVQQSLEDHFSTFLRQQVKFTGAGRTDAGVHAKHFIAHADMMIEHHNQLKDFIFKINRFLPKEIVIHDVIPVRPDAHARFDALSRTYHYYIISEKNPFIQHLSFLYTTKIDLDKMNKAADLLIGQKDFKSFAKTGTNVQNYICTIYEAYWEEQNNQLVFVIRADRFLRNMVRAIVGTLIDVGRGYLKPEDIRQIIDARDRKKAGTSVPGHALFLMNISYPDDVFFNIG